MSSRWDSQATVSKTKDDFPEPETPVTATILCFGMASEIFLNYLFVHFL